MHPIRLARARNVWPLLLLAALLGVLSLAACGTPSQVATPTATPDAQAILEQSSKVDFTDVTFDLTFSSTLLGQAINATGSGAVTKNPDRSQITISFPLTLAGKTEQFKIETITDSATKATYTRTTTNGVVGRWTKTIGTSSSSGGSVDATGLTSLNEYANVKLIGSETLNGVAVWHLQANPGAAPTTTPTSAATTATTPTTRTATPTRAPTRTPTVSAASATKTAVAGATQTAIANATTVDIYIRKDTSYPAKIAAHVAIPDATTDTTLTFTKFNSGVTITLPRV